MPTRGRSAVTVRPTRQRSPGQSRSRTVVSRCACRRGRESRWIWAPRATSSRPRTWRRGRKPSRATSQVGSVIVALKVFAFVLGFAVVALTCASAVRALVLPRGVPDTLSRIVFTTNRRLFNVWLRWARSYLERDAIMAFFAPLSVLALLPAWL